RRPARRTVSVLGGLGRCHHRRVGFAGGLACAARARQGAGLELECIRHARSRGRAHIRDHLREWLAAAAHCRRRRLAGGADDALVADSDGVGADVPNRARRHLRAPCGGTTVTAGTRLSWARRPVSENCSAVPRRIFTREEKSMLDLIGTTVLTAMIVVNLNATIVSIPLSPVQKLTTVTIAGLWIGFAIALATTGIYSSPATPP